MITQKTVDTIIEIKNIQDRCLSFDSLHQSTKLLDNLPIETLIKLYDRSIQCMADIYRLNKLLSNVCYSELDQEVLNIISMISAQKRGLEATLTNNLEAQNLKLEDLLTVQHKNKIRHFRSLLMMAEKRLETKTSKEQIEKDIKFLNKKFKDLSYEGVDSDFVADEYVNVLTKLENNL